MDKLPGGRVPTIVAIYLIPEATHFFRTKLTDFLKEQAKSVLCATRTACSSSCRAGLRVRVMSIAFKLYDWRPIAVGPQHNLCAPLANVFRILTIARSYIYDHTSLPS